MSVHQGNQHQMDERNRGTCLFRTLTQLQTPAKIKEYMYDVYKIKKRGHVNPKILTYITTINRRYHSKNKI